MSDPTKLAKIFVGEMRKAVASDEKDWGARVSRSFKRKWKHGNLKKTGAKVALGAGIGIITVTAAAVTGGLAVPVILAVAAGTYTVGQLATAGTAAGWGRGRRGGESTRSWMDQYRGLTPDGQVDRMFSLEQRVHKTIRRSLQHYHKAGRKFRTELVAARQGAVGMADCESARALVLAMFSVDHHLGKAHVYLEPAAWLCVLLLDTLEACQDTWAAADRDAETRLGAHFTAHNGEDCGSVAPCLAAGDFDADSESAKGAIYLAANAAANARWDTAAIKLRRDKLSAVTKRLQIRHALPPVPPPGASFSPGTKGRMDRLLADAGRDYRKNRGKALRVKHFVTNNWARRTRNEKIAFGVGQGVGAVMSVGGAVSGGMTAGLSIPAWVDPVQEFGSQAFGIGADSGIDKLAEHLGSSNDMEIEHGRGAANTAAESQDSLMKASIHMQEVLKRIEALERTPRGGDCDVAAEAYFALYQLEHHLGKTALYLDEAITQVDAIAGALHRFDGQFSGSIANDVYQAAFTILGGSHEYCPANAPCYGPHPANAGRPVRPAP